MFKFNSAKIYEIRCKQTGLCYIGSTTNTLNLRLSDHISSYNKWLKDEAPYCSSFEVIKGDPEIYLLENFPCDSKRELFRREGKWQSILKNFIVNKNISGRTYDEWKEDNRESIKKKAREYYQKNAEIQRIKRKEYRDSHKDEIKVMKKLWCENNKEHVASKKKIYALENKDKVKQYQAEYRDKKREHLKDYKKAYDKKNESILKQKKKEYGDVKITCECGSIIKRNSKSCHKRTKKHLKWIETSVVL